MVDVDAAVACKLKKDGKSFEVLVDPNAALKIKEGKGVNLDDALAYFGIYHDVRRGNVVSDEDLHKNFGTTDVKQVALAIIKEGNLQFTTEQRNKLVEEKRKKIADIISRRGINPQTNSPHPPKRILNAMEKGGARIEPLVDASLQVNEVLKKIKPLLPIKFQMVSMEITIPARHVGKAYHVLKKVVEKFKEKWLSDGSLRIRVELPAGAQAELLERMASVTRGDFSSKVLKRIDL